MKRAALLLAALLLLASPARGVDWVSVADVDVVRIRTTTEEGSIRETTIWLAVVDGQGYVRTSRTRWFRDVERDADVVLVIGEDAHPLRAERVTDQALFDRVQAVFRQKYGFWDRLTATMRFLGGGPRIFRLLPPFE